MRTARTLTAVRLCMGAPTSLRDTSFVPFDPAPSDDRKKKTSQHGQEFLLLSSPRVELEPSVSGGAGSSGDRHHLRVELHSSIKKDPPGGDGGPAEEPTATADMIEPPSASGRTDAERHAAVGSTRHGALVAGHSLLKRTMRRKKSEVQGSSFYGSKQVPPTPSPTPLRSKQNHHHDAQLSIDLSRDALALSVIHYIGDWGSSEQGFQQWCLSTGGLEGLAKCVDGLNVKREEVLRQLETRRQKYAFLFKPFRVEGEDESASSREGGETTMLLERPKTKKDTKDPDGKPQFPSPPGLLVVASEYNARRHQHDVETGVGKKGDNSREILCLTTAKENSGIPHGFKTQNELEHAWSKLLPDPHAQTQDKRSAGPLAVRWMKDPADCLRVRFFPLDRKELQEGEGMLGKRNAAWQLRAVLPKGLGIFCVDGGPGSPSGTGTPGARTSDRLMLWGCAPEQGRLKEDSDELRRSLVDEPHWKTTTHRWNMIRRQRWAVSKLDATSFPDAFLPTDEREKLVFAREKRNKKADHSNADGMGTSREGAVDHSAEVEKGASRNATTGSAGPNDELRDDDERPAFLLLLAGIFVAAAALFGCLGAICVLGCCCRPRPQDESAWSNSFPTATASGSDETSAALLSAGRDESGARTNAAVTAAAVAEPKKKTTKKKGQKPTSPSASGRRAGTIPRGEAGAPVQDSLHSEEAHEFFNMVAQNHADHGEEIEKTDFRSNRKAELEVDSHGALSFR